MKYVHVFMLAPILFTAACCSRNAKTSDISPTTSTKPSASSLTAAPTTLTPVAEPVSPSKKIDTADADPQGRLCGYIPPSERCNLEKDEGKPCTKEREHCGIYANPWGYDALVCENGRLVRYHENNLRDFAKRQAKEKELCETAKVDNPCEGDWSCRPDGKDCGGCEHCDFLDCEEGKWKQVIQPAAPNMCEACQNQS